MMVRLLSKLIYNAIVFPLLWGGSYVVSLFVAKVRIGLRERKGLLNRAREYRSKIGARKVVLFHCASAGEMEALKPLARKFDRKQFSIAVSYFSPSAKSALQQSKDFDFADYSPLDSPTHVRAYLTALKPAVIAITKHDIWPNFAWAAQQNNIPLFLINGNFHAKSMRLWPVVRQFHAAVYSAFNEIMAVSETDAQRARLIVGDSVKVSASGDSRYDRVLFRAQEKGVLPSIVSMCEGKMVVVAGSSHIEDEQLFLPALPELMRQFQNFRYIVVPHDPSDAAKSRIESLAAANQLRCFDVDTQRTFQGEPVILVNRSGILADLYRAGQIAFVGGGFGKGVHSVLEPMACGLPVLCGPNIVVSHEAGEAEKSGLLKVVKTTEEVKQYVEIWLSNRIELEKRHQAVLEFVQQRSGAVEILARRLQEAAGA